MAPASAVSVAEQIRRVPTATRSTVKAARRVVRGTAPRAQEVAYRSGPPRSTRYMWKLVRYAVGDAPVAGIGTFRDHAALFLYRGRELDDGSGLLEGGGTQMRFITLRSPADADRPAVRRIVRRAFSLALGLARRAER